MFELSTRTMQRLVNIFREHLEEKGVGEELIPTPFGATFPLCLIC